MLDIKLSEKEQLLFLRRRKGIKQADVAKYVGVQQSIISEFERGNRTMARERYEKYKDFIMNREGIEMI